jgi:pimeloyl-ACP methyl ester carboxylesterase
MAPVTAERTFETERRRTFYLECGPPDGPPLVFVHGWPALAFSWRPQLEHFAAMGYRCIAPDMRGYGGSSAPPRHEDYALEQIVGDMVELLAELGAGPAIWAGHDWGSPVVWELARQHPELCRGVVSMCVPYMADGFTPSALIPLVDRNVYPVAEYPAGQWDYILFYEREFDAARAAFEADVPATIKALFRSGSAKHRGRPAPTARISRDGGWFGGAGRAPDLPRDPAILSEEDLDRYVAAFERTGFFGPDAWYVNQERNGQYALASGRRALRLPVLFLHAAYDSICETVDSRMADPMRSTCSDLTEHVLETGHWIALERPAQVNAAIEGWLSERGLR